MTQPPLNLATRRLTFWRKGEPMIWTTGACLAIMLLMTASLLTVVLKNGLGYFWAKPLYAVQRVDAGPLAGQRIRQTFDPHTGEPRIQFKVGNRDLYGNDFVWVKQQDITSMTQPLDLALIERSENGDFIGWLQALTLQDLGVPGEGAAWERLLAARERIQPMLDRVQEAEDVLADLSYNINSLRMKIKKKIYEGADESSPAVQAIERKQTALETQFEAKNQEAGTLRHALDAYTATFRDIGGKEKVIALKDIVRAYEPNRLGLAGKMGLYGAKVWELLTEKPREANTEGGLFPAIFGTVMMVFLMSLFCIPLGVIAAIYLREYAKEGLTVRLVRIAVNNLSGVPSIVYGVFGLGFFVYGLGGWIDQVFFPERLPTPTYGTGGILWSSLTLALLTVPVVIVSTEEALAAIPRGMREGSLALGATKFQTIVRILLPMASPGILTGLVLSMARAAGEVAPLMLVGVVKLAPDMPLDGHFPFLHLERKFMHLGFHIYDVGFQSPNAEAAKPMVFVTTLLLVAIVVAMSAVAIWLRNSMKRRYTTGAF